MKKYLIFVALLISIIAFSQTMNIHKTNGVVDNYPLSDIDSITFTLPETELTVTDIDGNVYQTVKIGDQWWMAENLKVTRYCDGTPIPNVTDNTDWLNLVNDSTGAYCEYDNNSVYVVTYGRLYNWYAINENCGIAPAGWHVPTDSELKQLEMYLGMSQSEADFELWRGSDQGCQLAGNANLWNDGPLEDDVAFGSSGFMAIPGGFRNYNDNGNYNGLGDYAFFWSATEATEYTSFHAWARSLYYYYPSVLRDDYGKGYGFSVRCVKD